MTAKQHEITAEDDDTRYNYYQIGDRVRYHGSLRTYEKYDKSKDSIIFCNACASLNEITAESVTAVDVPCSSRSDFDPPWKGGRTQAA